MSHKNLDNLLEIVYFAYQEGRALCKSYNQAQRVFLSGLLQGLITGSKSYILTASQILDIEQSVEKDLHAIDSNGGSSFIGRFKLIVQEKREKLAADEASLKKEDVSKLLLKYKVKDHQSLDAVLRKELLSTSEPEEFTLKLLGLIDMLRIQQQIIAGSCISAVYFFGASIGTGLACVAHKAGVSDTTVHTAAKTTSILAYTYLEINKAITKGTISLFNLPIDFALVSVAGFRSGVADESPLKTAIPNAHDIYYVPKFLYTSLKDFVSDYVTAFKSIKERKFAKSDSIADSKGIEGLLIAAPQKAKKTTEILARQQLPSSALTAYDTVRAAIGAIPLIAASYVFRGSRLAGSLVSTGYSSLAKKPRKLGS